jgi:hypothetical protein
MGVFSRRQIGEGRKIHCLPTTRVEVKYKWSHTSTFCIRLYGVEQARSVFLALSFMEELGRQKM